MKKKTFAIFLVLEMAVAGWFGWQYASAKERGWARAPSSKKRST